MSVTMRGVTKISRFVRFFESLVDRNRTPRNGMSPSSGTFVAIFVVSSRIRPLITTVARSGTVTVVVTSRLELVGVCDSVCVSSTTASMLGLRSSWISRSGFTWGVSVSLMPTSCRSMFWM